MNKYHSEENWLCWVDELSEKNFVVIDRFVGDECYRSIRDFLDDELPNFQQAGIGALDQNTINKKIRGDSTFWLSRNRDTRLHMFWELVDELIYIFNRHCFLSLGGYEFHLAKYPPGGYYAKHVDQFQDRNNRIISVVIYLNDAWKEEDGGELELFHQDRSVIVAPIAGRCVLFKSEIVPHAVLRSNKDRFSLTGWLLHKPSSLGQLFG